MSQKAITVFEKTVHKTNAWLSDMMEQIEWMDEQQAYRSLKAVLTTLRDELQLAEVAQLAAQMPMLVRGMFYEDWAPKRAHIKPKTIEDFLAAVEEKMQCDDDYEALVVVRAVFEVLNRHISFGEIVDIVQNLPKDLQALWPQPPIYEARTS